MLLAIVGTLFHHEIVDYKWIAIALVLGSIIGVPLGRVPMTAVPAANGLEPRLRRLVRHPGRHGRVLPRTPTFRAFTMAVLGLEVILGSLTFTGSLMAAGKLQEILPQRPITYQGPEYRQPFVARRFAAASRRLPGVPSRADASCFR